MAAFQPKKIYKLEDYLELERNSEEKYEFWDGNVWSMSGASANHNRIVRNLNTQIDIQLSKNGCEVFPSDMRIKVPAYPPYRYPDISALCGDTEIESIGQIEMLTNPQLIIEVLSESTEAFDRGDKFSYYKSIESFSEYLLIAQHRPHVSQFIKQGDGFWINTEANSLEDAIELRSVPCSLQLSSIYRGVDFEAVGSR